jgi:hypothetical protein
MSRPPIVWGKDASGNLKTRSLTLARRRASARASRYIEVSAPPVGVVSASVSKGPIHGT